jgi:hypothetical protein
MAVFDSSTSKEPVKAVIESDRYRETFVYVDGKLEEYSLDEKVAKARA